MGFRLRAVDRAAASFGAADTAFVVGVQGGFVVDRDLFAGLDVLQGEEQNVIVDDLHERVGDAGVIDVVRTVSTAATVETPTMVDFADAQHLSMCTTTCFGVGDLLACVLRDLVTLLERDGGKAAFTVYRRRLDC